MEMNVILYDTNWFQDEKLRNPQAADIVLLIDFRIQHKKQIPIQTIMTLIAQSIVMLFGVFLIGVGVLMLLLPSKANAYLRKAGSTNLINYTEISIRMIPAAAMVVSADLSKYPEAFRLLGWFMIATSVVLFFVPRNMHHAYALRCADLLTPTLTRIVSPFSMLFGAAVIYAVL